jgi:hypothetical protein
MCEELTHDVRALSALVQTLVGRSSRWGGKGGACMIGARLRSPVLAPFKYIPNREVLQRRSSGPGLKQNWSALDSVVLSRRCAASNFDRLGPVPIHSGAAIHFRVTTVSARTWTTSLSHTRSSFQISALFL